MIPADEEKRAILTTSCRHSHKIQILSQSHEPVRIPEREAAVCGFSFSVRSGMAEKEEK